MNTGQIISGAGHIGLIGWLLFGGSLRTDPLPLDVMQVTAVTSEEYADIVSGAAQPSDTEEIAPPAPLESPAVPQDTPDLTSEADPAPDTPQPDPAPEAAPDPAPQPPVPAEQAEVSDEAPVIEPPSEDMAALRPDPSLRPVPRPAERVAPQQVAPPEPDTQVDDVVREEAVPDEAAETPREEAESTAPEAAATEIVTEAEQPAPSKSVRPRSRPNRPAPAPEPAPETQTAEAEPAPQPDPAPQPKPAPQPEPEPEPAAPAADTAGIEDALAAALGGTSDTPTPSAPAGPPLTAGEKEGMRLAVQSCWNIGALSSEALATVVTVAFELTEDARPIDGTIRMIDATGGSSGAAKQAYEAARRAIIRCGARGFALPVEKYASWRNVELVFNPESKRIK
ncbi:energy transducer TonB [Pelagivirga sediminicola]|uniref:Energy transducer TonB n=1 Tax=Pelagivirga sediminicola TaxID=2170575 RepID=A0A2T7G7A9_9RHOB|nr:energy transducer TonB [Pelagivirga sediminicola]PVA10266.1 energy transducer TonB [Pelagivirga sediminicola]